MMQNKNVLGQKPIDQNHGSIFVKYLYLSKQNINMGQTISELKGHIECLRKINDQLCEKIPKSIQILINQLTQQNKALEKTLFRLIKNNQQLSCELLMKSQLLSQNQSQFKEILQSYQQKIYELRILLQNKEVVITSIEEFKEESLKEQAYLTSKTNIIEFNEVHLLRNLIQRYKLQNQELRAINQLKEQHLEQKIQQLKKIQRVLEQNKNWGVYKKMIFSENKSQKTKQKKIDARLKLQQQLTKYDIKYIKHRNEAFTKSSIANQINNFKLILINLNSQLRKEKEAKINMMKQAAKRENDYKNLKQKYQKSKKEIFANLIELQFYRNNFKELNKIRKQQKIKYFNDYYHEVIPQLQIQKQKKALISYWKYWYNNHLTKNNFQKCIINKKKFKNRIQITRNNSCPLKYSYRKQSFKNQIMNVDKSYAIFSFINQSHNINKTIANPFLEDPQQILVQQKQFPDISEIIKHKKVEEIQIDNNQTINKNVLENSQV